MKTKFFQITYITFFSLFTFVGFGTLELYLTNNAEFWFTFADILPVILIGSLILFFALTILLFFLPESLSNYLLVIIWALTIAIYIQGNFLPNNYGALAGEAIPWEEYHMRAIINSIVWCVIIVAVICVYNKMRKQFYRIANVISAIVLATQISTLVVLGITSPIQPQREHILTEEKMLEVSNHKNLIVFVLDCFDSEIFVDLLEHNNSKLKAQYEDFIFYHNTVGGATRTKYAIPYILTGQPYIEPVSYPKYLQDSFSESPLLNTLGQLDYDVRLFAQDDYIDVSQPENIHNIRSAPIKPISHLGLTKDFLKLTAFRYSPHIFKKYFWMYSDDFERWKGKAEQYSPYTLNDPVFYQKLISDRLQIQDSKYAFRFYHLMGAHPPYTMSSDCRNIPSEEGNETDQALGSLRIVSEYIDQLKKAGVYDHSTIVIMSDHGSRDLEQNPLFLLKTENECHPFIESEFALSYANLQDIFINVLDGNSNPPEEYIVPENERYFYVGSGTNNTLNVIEYATKDVAYNIDSFYSTGNIYHGDTDDINSSKKYRIGSQLLFTAEGTANQFCVEGFSGNEGNLTWTVGKQSKMDFELDGKYTNLLLEIDCSTTRYRPERLSIYANDHFVSEHIVKNRGVISTVIPAEYIENNKLILEFRHPDAISPLSTGLATDSRVLGICMFKLSLSNTKSDLQFLHENMLENKIQIDFSASGNSEEFILNGWWDQEKEHRWTSASADFYFAVPDKLTCKMDIQGKPFKDGPVEILVNGQTLSTMKWTRNEPSKSIVIPADMIEEKGYIIITLKVPEAVSPKSLSLSNDSRVLGIILDKIDISVLK